MIRRIKIPGGNGRFSIERVEQVGVDGHVEKVLSHVVLDGGSVIAQCSSLEEAKGILERHVNEDSPPPPPRDYSSPSFG